MSGGSGTEELSASELHDRLDRPVLNGFAIGAMAGTALVVGVVQTAWWSQEPVRSATLTIVVPIMAWLFFEYLIRTQRVESLYFRTLADRGVEITTKRRIGMMMAIPDPSVPWVGGLFGLAALASIPWAGIDALRMALLAAVVIVVSMAVGWFSPAFRIRTLLAVAAFVGRRQRVEFLERAMDAHVRRWNSTPLGG